MNDDGPDHGAITPSLYDGPENVEATLPSKRGNLTRLHQLCSKVACFPLTCIGTTYFGMPGRFCRVDTYGEREDKLCCR